MIFLVWMLLSLASITVQAEDSIDGVVSARQDGLFKRAVESYALGKYSSTVNELQAISLRHDLSKKDQALVKYWMAICYSRLQEFPDALKSFEAAINLGHAAKDLHYEYGQALFASEKLLDARKQFRKSLDLNFKRAVSLYYIGFISKELGDNNKAFAYLRAIEQLQDSEAAEVRQAAEMQIADLYLEQVEKHPKAFSAVETYVIPQYEKALGLNPYSSLAPVIEEKIIGLQRKYELVLFQLRNGRPTLRPPYFARVAGELGRDSNVTFTPNDTTVASSKQSSLFAKTSAMGRYTFYHQDYLSLAPEMNFSYTRYLNRVPEIYRNDNYFLAPALRSAYEHTLWEGPASHLLDYEFTEIRRDVDAEKKIKFNSRSHGLVIGERFNYFLRGESTVRLRYRVTDSYLDSSDSKTLSLIYEQVLGFNTETLLAYVSYDRLRMSDSSFDTNALTVRGDLIIGRWRDDIIPTVGLGLSSTDPVNNPDRGRELLVNPSVRLSKVFKKNWRANLKYENQTYDSKDELNFAYKKTIYSFELEYLF